MIRLPKLKCSSGFDDAKTTVYSNIDSVMNYLAFPLTTTENYDSLWLYLFIPIQHIRLICACRKMSKEYKKTGIISVCSCYDSFCHLSFHEFHNSISLWRRRTVFIQNYFFKLNKTAAFRDKKLYVVWCRSAQTMSCV